MDARQLLEIKTELESTGADWRIENGKRHNKILVEGKLVGTFPRTGNPNRRAFLNVRAQVRRLNKSLQGG